MSELQKKNLVLRHWRGELQSNALLLVVAIVPTLSWHVAWRVLPNIRHFRENYAEQLAMLSALLLTFVLITTWQVVGMVRAYRRGSPRTFFQRFIGPFGFLALLTFLTWNCYHVGGAMLAAGRAINDVVKSSGNYRIYVRDSATLVLDGEIGFGSARRTISAIEQNHDITVLRLNSPGGSVMEAYMLGDFVGKHKLTTLVKDSCLSACTVVFASGARRLATRTAKFGFHGFTAGALASADVKAGAIEKYRELLSSSGVHSSFIDYAISITPPSYWVPLPTELIDGGFVHAFIDE